MRLLRVRITVRGLMILVAVLAAAIGAVATAVRLERRRGEFRMLAEMHAAYEEFHARRKEKGRRSIETFEALDLRIMRVEEDIARFGLDDEIEENRPEAFHRRALEGVARIVKRREDVARHTRLEDHHARMRSKYLYAVDHPWEPVAPDPAPPD